MGVGGSLAMGCEFTGRGGEGTDCDFQALVQDQESWESLIKNMAWYNFNTQQTFPLNV